MKYLCFFLFLVSLLVGSCVENTLDNPEVKKLSKSSKAKTRAMLEQDDSLAAMSRIQRDLDYLMMNRIIEKDGIFVLSIKREDALFIGINPDEYDKYVRYVEELNGNLQL